MAIPLVSVVIPAFNEEEVIEKNLKSLKNQSYKNIEIVIVDDGSTDNTAKIAAKFTNKLFRGKRSGRSKQRNFGATKSKGDFLLFLDCDMELSKNVIKECIETTKKYTAVGAVAIPEVSVAKTYWEKVKAFERSFYNEAGDVHTDAARFFKKSVFNKVGGYDESLMGPEDWDLPDRVVKSGYKLARIKSTLYHFERIPGIISLARKKYYYALTAHRYFEKNKISIVGPKTLYFMRPVFYKNWKKLLINPVMSISMMFMLTLEQFGGGAGYIIGKYKKYESTAADSSLSS